MSEDFTRRKAEWIEAITFDTRLGAFAVRVGCALASFFNRETGEAWPTQETIANAIQATERGVRKAVDELVTAGHLEVTAGRGRKVSSRYRMATENRNRCSAQEPEKAEPPFRSNDAKEEPPFRISDKKEEQPFLLILEESGTAIPPFAQKSGTAVPKKAEPPFRQNPYREPLESSVGEEPFQDKKKTEEEIPAAVEARPPHARVKASRAKPELPLPSGWLPSKETSDWAEQRGWSREVAQRQLEEFTDYWHSDQPAKPNKRDWDQAFKNRLRSVEDRNGGRPPVAWQGRGNGSRPLNPGIANLMNKLDELDEREPFR